MISKEVKKNLENSSWIRKMFEQGAELKKTMGEENVFDFSLGNPDLPPPKEALMAMHKFIDDPTTHRYMPNMGFVEVRETMAKYESDRGETEFSSDNIVMTVGAAGGLNVALKSILNPGDEVIILRPFFVEYIFYIKNHGGVPVVVNTDMDTFMPNADAIMTAITPKTKAIILNSPNNPTGVVYKEDVLKSVAQAIGDIYVLSDEPYVKLSYGVPIVQLADIFKNCLIINSFSKSLALPGERIGYIAASPKCDNLKLLCSALAFSNRTLGFVNAPGLMQRTVAAAIDSTVDVGEYAKRRDMFMGILSKAGFECAKPEGAFYLFPKCPKGMDDVEFVNLAATYGLLLVPGSGFGAPGYFRVTYCVDRGVIKASQKAFMKLAVDLKLI